LHRNADSLSKYPCEKGNCNYCHKVESKEEKLIGRITFVTEEIN